MAARASSNGVNKSQAIRDAAAAIGARARPRDVISQLKERGIEVSAALVTNVMSRSGAGKRRRQRATTRAAKSIALVKPPKASAIARSADDDNLSMAALLSAKRFVNQVGSVDVARRALEAIVKLTSA